MTQSVDWLLIEVTGYNVRDRKIFAKNVSNGKLMQIEQEPTQKKSWIGWLSDPQRPESAPAGSILAIYNVKSCGPESNQYTAGWGTTITKDISSESVIIAPFTVSHSVKTFPNSDNKYIDGILLDNKSIYVDDSENIRDIAREIIDQPASPLIGQRGFMIRAVSNTDTDVGHIEAFYGRKGLTGAEMFDFHLNRKPQNGFKRNRLRENIENVRSALIGGPDLAYEVVGFSRSIIQSYGSDKKLHDLSQMPNYRINSLGDRPSRQAFSYAAVVVSHDKPNQIKHHLPLPKGKICNSLFGVLNITEQQKQAVGVISISGVKKQFAIRKDSPQYTPNYPLEQSDFKNNSGKVRSFRIRCKSGQISTYTKRIVSAVPGVTPFQVENKSAYSFPIEFKPQITAALSDLLGTAPLYLRQAQINGAPRLFLDGRTNDPSFREYLERIKQSVPHTEDDQGNVNYDVASYDQLASLLERIPPADKQEKLIIYKNSVTQPNPKPERLKTAKKLGFSDWLEKRFMGRYDAMVDFLYSDIIKFAANEAHIDWSHSAPSCKVGSGNSKGEIVRRSNVRPVSEKRTHSGSVAYSINTYEKIDPKHENPLRSFTINFINKAVDRKNAFVFNGYEYLKDAYERDNGLTLTNNTADTLKKLEEDRNKRVEAQKIKTKNNLEKEERTREYWMKTFPSYADENGSSSLFLEKNISSIIGNICLKMGEDTERGRFTAIRLHDTSDNFRGVQRIFERPWKNSDDKWDNKLFTSGSLFQDSETGNKYGTHCVIGDLSSDIPIYFGEGLSTCGSIFEATACPTVVALNAGNLPYVVAAFRAKYPDRKFIVVADNDMWKPLKGNPGVTAAIKASFENNAHYVIPEFNSLIANKKPTDVNDLRKHSGLDALRTQLHNVQHPIEKNEVYNTHQIKYCGIESLDKTISSIIDSRSGGEKIPLARSLLYVAINTYGRQEVLDNLAPEYAQYVSFSEPKLTTNDIENHFKQAEVQVVEAISPSTNKYCLIKDRTGGAHRNKIEDTLDSIVGKNALAYNPTLKGWIAPYPTIKIIKAYLFTETNSSPFYIGKSRSKSNTNRFVVRGDFGDDETLSRITGIIEFAEPRLLKSEYGLVIDDIRHLDKVKELLSEYLVAPTASIADEPTVKDPHEARIENILSQARKISGEPNSRIIQTVHMLSGGNQPLVFSDDDYVYSALYSRSAQNIDAGEKDKHHYKVLSDASSMFINLDRQGALDAILSLDQRSNGKSLAIHLKTILSESMPFDESNITRICDNHQISKEEFLTIYFGKIDSKISESINRQSVISDIRRSLSQLSYSVIKKNNLVKESPTNAITQEDRVKTLIELTGLAASEGYDLEEYQNIFLKTEGSPYHPRGGTFSPSDLASDILYIDRNKTLAESSNKISDEAGLFEYFVTRSATDRLDNYYKYIQAMIADRGMISYERYSAYLKGKVNTVVDADNPYYLEGEFDESLLIKDVNLLTMYKSHQALYREYGASLVNESDIFHDKEGQSDTASVQTEIRSFKGELEFNGDKYPYFKFSGEGVDLIRLRCTTNNHEGESMAIDEWFENLESTREFLRAIKAGDTHEINLIETDVIQHAESNGMTFSVSNIIMNPEIYYFSGGHPLVANLADSITDNKLSALKIFVESKNTILKSQSITIGEVDKQPSLSVFIEMCVDNACTVDEFTQLLTKTYGVESNHGLIGSIKNQYQQLIESKPKTDSPHVENNKFEVFQAIITQLISDGLDYDDIYEELIGKDGSLSHKNPYYDKNNGLDRKSLVNDLKSAGFSSLKKLYECRYTVLHGNPIERDSFPRTNTLLPSTIIDDAPLKAQFELLIDTVRNYEMTVLAFDKNNFPSLDEWKRSTVSVLPIHPILAIDLNSENAIDGMLRYGEDPIRLLADIHCVDSKENSETDSLARAIISQWAVRTQISNVSFDEIRDLTQDERNDIAIALSIPDARANVSATSIVKHMAKLESEADRRIREYSYIIAAVAYEIKYNHLPSYARRAIFDKLASEETNKDEVEIKRTDRNHSRCQATTALKVIGAIPSLQRVTFSSDTTKRVELVSESGTDYIGNYKHFYAKTASNVELPREVSHHGVYENSVYGLPYALSSDECSKSNLSPLSKYATKKVLSSLDAWLSEFGSIGIQSLNTDHLYVLTRINDRTLLSTHNNTEFDTAICGELDALLSTIPTDLVVFTDRNEISESISAKLQKSSQLSFVDVESRLHTASRTTLENTRQNISAHPLLSPMTNDFNHEDHRTTIHGVARKILESQANCILRGNDINQNSETAFLTSLPPLTPLPLATVNEMTLESRKHFARKRMPIEGVKTDTQEYERALDATAEHQSQEICPLAHYISIIEKKNPRALEALKNDKYDTAPSVDEKGITVGCNVFLSDGARTNICAKVIDVGGSEITVSSAEIQSAISSIQKSELKARRLIVNIDTNEISTDAVEVNSQTDLASLIGGFGQFELNALSKALSLSDNNSSTQIIEKINDLLSGENGCPEVLNMIQTACQRQKDYLIEKCGLKEMSGKIDEDMKTLTFGRENVNIYSISTDDQDPRREYTSLSELVAALESEDNLSKMKAHSFIYFQGLCPLQARSVSKRLPEQYDLIRTPGDDSTTWSLSTPTGLQPENHKTLATAIMSTEDTLTSLPKPPITPNLTTMLSVNFGGHAADIKPISTANQTDKNQEYNAEVNEHQSMASPLDRLDSLYLAKLEIFFGGLDEWVDLMSHERDAASPEDSDSAKYFHERSVEEERMAQAICQQSSDIQIHRSGRDYVLSQRGNNKENTESTYLNLPAISSYLVGESRKGIKKFDYAPEEQKSNPRSCPATPTQS